MDTANQVGGPFWTEPSESPQERLIAAQLATRSARAINWRWKLAGLFIFFNKSSLRLSLQLASVRTFQVLKLPLGFIRVLQWVSPSFILQLHYDANVNYISSFRMCMLPQKRVNISFIVLLINHHIC